jgi:hypothetical protein
MLELYPYVGVTGNLGVIIGVVSYGETLGVGVTVDADIVPDPGALATAIEESARALIDAAGVRVGA